VPAGIRLNANIRRAGEDTAAGTILLRTGCPLGPAEVGILASVGLSRVNVHAPLRVAVFSSGDELAQPGEKLSTGAVYDANRPMLLAMLARLSMTVSDMGVLPDGKAAIHAALAGASASHDAIVTSAGVSVGDEDHIRGAVESLGELDFQGVALKPGSPMTAGHVGGVPFFGLPGNPVAMMVNFLMLARPGLLSLAGAKVGPPRRQLAQAGFAAASKPGRREFLRGVIAVENGTAVVRPCARGGSGILSSLVACDGLIELEESVSQVTAGMTVPFIPLAELGL
jgi:molybdopterin molybdotransferase